MESDKMACGTLSQRRHITEIEWRQFVTGAPLLRVNRVPGDIIQSWKRSTQYIKPDQTKAPADDEYTSILRWKESLLYPAARREQEPMIQLANEGKLAIAFTDPCGRLLWTFASKPMRERARAINFTAGGHWHEHAIGTNAVGLSIKLRCPVTVFSSEHFQPFLHDWVSYAAPIEHPQTGEVVGILNLSSTWTRHTPLGQAAVTELARSIARYLPRDLPRAELEIHALGQPRIQFRCQRLSLPMRQVEMLCLLALNQQGLSLEGFHAALYGDASVATSTLKAELSRLRRLLDGQIGSRPYRLQVPVWADFIHVWQALRQQQMSEAFSLYRGSFLPQSTSPELEEWRCCIDAVMEQTLETCQDTTLLIKTLCHCTAGSELVRERLLELVSGSAGSY